MNNDIEHPNNPTKGKAMAGIILLAIGGILLLRQFADIFIPGWLFSWPMWLIAWGLYLGAKHNFRKPVWAVMIGLGVAFLFTENIDNADEVVWPIALIGVGAWMVLRNKDLFHHQYKESSFKEL